MGAPNLLLTPDTIQPRNAPVWEWDIILFFGKSNAFVNLPHLRGREALDCSSTHFTKLL